jgi:hypothetical protein
MTRTSTPRTLAVLLALTALLLGACGGGDDESLSDEEFCAVLEDLEASDDSEDVDEEEVAQLRELAQEAPNDEMRSAPERSADVGEEMIGLDEDDPEAFGTVMGLMFQPDVIAALETIETYLEDTCGVALSETETDAAGGSSDDAPVGDDDGAPDRPSSGSAMDDLESSVLREAMVTYIEDAGADPDGSSMSISGAMGSVTVQFGATGVEGVDGVELCEELAKLVDDATGDADDVDLEITLDEMRVAERPAGGSCRAA